MKFMFHWKALPGFHKRAAEAFLETQASMPEGLKVIGRWHAPGSVEGWLLTEAADLAPVAVHAGEWADLLEIRVTPVVEDEVAGEVFAAVYSQP